MLHESLELHNVAELEPWCGGGVLLQRLPRAVREQLTDRGRQVGQGSAGSEIRFVTEAHFINIYLHALQGAGERVIIFAGDIQVMVYELRSGMNTISFSPLELFARLRPEFFAGGRFAPQVWRIFLPRCLVALQGVDTMGWDRRPPRAEELPARRWLAYGSSITNGSASSMHHLSYVQQAAWRLGVDVLNLGLGGACLCEAVMADHLAGLKDWDFATLELGVNMRWRFDSQEFERRARYLVGQVVTQNPGKPVVLITIFRNSAGWLREEDQNGRREAEFNTILRQIKSEDQSGRLHLLEGSQLLSRAGGLTGDLIHPSDYGMIEMGENLAQGLRRLAV